VDKRAWLAFLAWGALVMSAYPFIPVGSLRDVVFLAAPISSVGAILLGVRLHRPARRAPWYLMAGGFALWVLADALYGWYANVLKVDPFPSLADVFYLAGYPLLALALGLLIRVRGSGRDLTGLIDSAVVTVGLGLLSWVFLAGPVLGDTEQPLLARAVGAAYPAADILLLGLLVRLVTTAGARTSAFRLLTASTILLLVADTAFGVLAVEDSYVGGVIDLVWVAAYVLTGAAALHPSMRTLTEKGGRRRSDFTRRRLAALTLAVLIAPCTLAAQLLLGVPVTGWAVVASSIALFLLVVARMYAAIQEIVASNLQRDQLQDDLVHQAAHDSLTLLANRVRVLELVTAALHRGQRSGTPVGLLFIDLDGFKAVNDSFGHRSGDDVLRETATRLRTLVRAGDTVGRLGGDEFVVLVEPLDSAAELLDLADRLIAAVAAPIETAGGRVTVGASIGVAVSLDGSTDAGQLLHHADIAAYRAKAGGRGRAEVFDDALRHELDERAALEAAIEVALATDEFLLHYQPVVNLLTGAVHGYEALIRWERPGHGLVPPDSFIPVAERSNLICDIDRWVLRHALRQLREWTRASPEQYAGVTLAVNISGRHLASPSIVPDVVTALEEAGVAPTQLVLEITETVLVDEPGAVSHLRALRALGVVISIDDFGTGYTSIGQLQHLDVDVLKIDRSFIGSHSPGTHELVTLMINAAHAFGLHVVAEGVEDDEQLAPLRHMLCDSGQGYLFGRPAPAAAITAGPATSVEVRR